MSYFDDEIVKKQIKKNDISQKNNKKKSREYENAVKEFKKEIIPEIEKALKDFPATAKKLNIKPLEETQIKFLAKKKRAWRILLDMYPIFIGENGKIYSGRMTGYSLDELLPINEKEAINRIVNILVSSNSESILQGNYDCKEIVKNYFYKILGIES